MDTGTLLGTGEQSLVTLATNSSRSFESSLAVATIGSYDVPAIRGAVFTI